MRESPKLMTCPHDRQAEQMRRARMESSEGALLAIILVQLHEVYPAAW